MTDTPDAEAPNASALRAAELPKRKTTALGRMEAAHQHLLKDGRIVNARLDESLPVPAKPCKRRRCKHRHQVERRFANLFIDASPARVLPPSLDSRLGDRFPGIARRNPDPEAPVVAERSLCILSIGYTDTVDGFPPSAPAQADAAASTIASSSRMPGSAVRSGLIRGVAATEPIPADPAKQEARVPRCAEHAASVARLRAVHLS
jgi:hypothetical protein